MAGYDSDYIMLEKAHEFAPLPPPGLDTIFSIMSEFMCSREDHLPWWLGQLRFAKSVSCGRFHGGRTRGLHDIVSQNIRHALP